MKKGEIAHYEQSFPFATIFLKSSAAEAFVCGKGLTYTLTFAQPPPVREVTCLIRGLVTMLTKMVVMTFPPGLALMILWDKQCD